MIDVDYNEYKETIADNMRLIQEKHKLKEKIDKAIEYIEKSWSDKCTIPLEEVGYSTDNRWEIWKILKGSDKSE